MQCSLLNYYCKVGIFISLTCARKVNWLWSFRPVHWTRSSLHLQDAHFHSLIIKHHCSSDYIKNTGTCTLFYSFFQVHFKQPQILQRSSEKLYRIVTEAMSEALYDTQWKGSKQWMHELVSELSLMFHLTQNWLYQWRVFPGNEVNALSLIHIWRCRRSTLCRSRWSPYH